MDIYTRRGDAGETDLMDQSRVSKAHPRIEAYGTADELNALVGSIRPTGEEEVDAHLRDVQDHLHILSADLANPEGEEGPSIEERHVDAVEEWIDEAEAELDPLDQFILPGGGETGSDLHHARTVCRRAERRVVALAAADGETVADPVLAYLNRLSDALFVFARLVNQRTGHAEEHPSY